MLDGGSQGVVIAHKLPFLSITTQVTFAPLSN